MIVIVFAQIFIIPQNKTQKILLFLEILSIPIIFTLTQQLLYKTVLGRDSWLHWVLTTGIISTGKMYEIVPSPYVKMPIFHILIASTSIISGLHYKWSSFFIAEIGGLLLNMLVIYLISIRLFNERQAFLSLLFIGISDNILGMIGKSIIPNTIGVGITSLLLILFLKKNLIIDKKKNLIIIILAIGLVFMHTISYSFLFLQLSILLIVEFIYRC